MSRHYCLSRTPVFLLILAASLAVTVPLSSQEPKPTEENQPVKPVEMNEKEQAFAQAMSGATLSGSFTVTGRDEDGLPKLSAENYQLGEVRKVAEGKWLIPARIKYGDKDVTLPLTLPVQWAGDTAVIIVDKIGFPGLGTYSARVLIHDGRYAGYWAGADHGGHLFGEVKKPEE
jgi:hypothetical protein